MITYMIASCLLFLLLYLALASVVRPKNFPPGPTGLPFFGSYHYLKPDAIKKTPQYFKTYGNIFSVKMQHRNVICIRGPKLIKQVMSTNPKPYSSRLDTLHSKLMRGNSRDGVVFSRPGEQWAAHRKLFHNVIRKLGLNSGDNVVVKELPYFCDELQKQESECADFSNVFDYAVLNVLAYFIFGNRYSYGDPKLGRLMHLNNQYFKLMGNAMTPSFVLVSLVPYLHKLWLPNAMKKAIACSKELEAFISSEIEYHKSTLDPGEPRDFIDFYLVEMMNLGSNSNCLKNYGLVTTVLDLFQAGTESTAATMKWAVLHMANNLEIQEKVFTEISTVLGQDQLPTYEDRKKLPYTEATILEVQRKSNIFPFGALPLATKERVHLEGYDLPKDTAIIVDYGSMHFSPEHWKNPNQFDPENFLDTDGTVGSRPGFMPYGGGLRNCLGKKIAKQMVFLFFASMVQRFKFLPPPGIHKLDEGYVLGVSSHPKPYKIHAKKRL